MAQTFGIEIANSSLKKLEPTLTNEFELQEIAIIVPKSAYNDVEVPKIDENRIEIAANENSSLNESKLSPENQSEPQSSLLKGNSSIDKNLKYLT